MVKLWCDIRVMKQVCDIQCSCCWYSDVLLIVIVGYINVGKFSLFNVLIGVGVLVQDVLFVILEFIIRCVEFGDGRLVVFIDIVGFVWYLFIQLVEVFCFMLEEVVYVDLLVYVVDGFDGYLLVQIDVVCQVIFEVIVDYDGDLLFELLVVNKVDVVSDLMLVKLWYGLFGVVFVFVCIGDGIDVF